jgi:hypothetical protein
MNKNNLGQPGYRAVLVNLPASLKQYEGAFTTTVEVLSAPDRRGSGLFNICAVMENVDSPPPPIHLSLRGKYLEPVVDRFNGGAEAKYELAKLSKDGYYKDCVQSGDSGPQLRPGDSGNNRSSVKAAKLKFIQQFRTAMGTRKKAGVRELLVEMDDDGNGSIDKKELLLGAHTLGIAVTPTEIEMIWPLFGPFDDEGNIEIDRFLRLVIANKTKGKPGVRTSLESTMLALQKMNRTERIDKKTQLSKTLAKLSVDFRERTLAQVSRLQVQSVQTVF